MQVFIDCWAKLLDPNTILVKDVPPGDESYDLLNDRAEYLSGLTGPWGRPYTIIRVYCPAGTAYTNSLILNDKVLVPIFGSDYDTTALRIYEEAMPGYEVLGFTGSWLDNDAIHCRTMGVPDSGLLYIEHVPLPTTGDTANTYEITARIILYSMATLISDSSKIFYRGDETSYQSTALISTAVPDSFVGHIPAFPGGTTVDYYLQAADMSGRQVTHPYIGAPWAHRFYINHSPMISGGDTIWARSSQPFAWFPEFYDLDDSVLTVEYVNYPQWLYISNDSLVGTAPDYADTNAFTVTVSDSYNTAVLELALMVTTNVPPVFISPDSLALASAAEFA